MFVFTSLAAQEHGKNNGSQITLFYETFVLRYDCISVIAADLEILIFEKYFNMSSRASFRGTIWESALLQATQIQRARSDDTVVCPIPSCRHPNKFFSNPRDLRRHAHTYHSESIMLPNQSNELPEEVDDMMVVDDVAFNTISILNPAPLSINDSDSFIIIKYENNQHFKVNLKNLIV